MSEKDEATAAPRRTLIHDLRNSLFALRTGIDLLPELRQDAKNFDAVHRILQTEIKTAAELLNKLLDDREASVR